MPKSKPRVFLDSNVLFSALYNPEGAPGAILELFIKGDIHIVVSQQVLEEVIRTIKEKLPSALLLLKTFLINIPPEIVAEPGLEAIEHWKAELSLADAAILTSAIKAHPDYFITGDNHFLNNANVGKDSGLRIVTPTQLIELLKQDNESV